MALQSADRSCSSIGWKCAPRAGRTPHLTSHLVVAYCYGRERDVDGVAGASPAMSALARECGYTFAFTTENRVDAKFVGDELARRDARSGR